jgi:hypothetical protein
MSSSLPVGSQLTESNMTLGSTVAPLITTNNRKVDGSIPSMAATNPAPRRPILGQEHVTSPSLFTEHSPL